MNNRTPEGATRVLVIEDKDASFQRYKASFGAALTDGAVTLDRRRIIDVDKITDALNEEDPSRSEFDALLVGSYDPGNNREVRSLSCLIEVSRMHGAATVVLFSPSGYPNGAEFNSRPYLTVSYNLIPQLGPIIIAASPQRQMSTAALQETVSSGRCI